MKNDLTNAKLWTLGILGLDPHGKTTIIGTIQALGNTAHHAMRRMKKDTEGASLCIMGGTV